MTSSVLPTIAAIIPVYNRENTIIKCVESVLAQTHLVDEIIIIDDCSTDNTANQLKIFGDKINILHTMKQSGAQAARNIGIRSAKSNWIAFLDSDDEWLPNKIDKQISVLNSVKFNENTVVHGDCYISAGNNSNKKIWHPTVINGPNVYNQLLASTGTLFPSILASKVALEKIGLLDEKVESYQEWDTAIQLAKFCKFIHIKEPLFIYRIHEQTISKGSNKSVNGYQYIVNKHKQEILKNCGASVFNNHLYFNAKSAMNSKQFGTARNILKLIEPKNVKVTILQLLCRLKIRPLPFAKMRQFLSWKR